MKDGSSPYEPVRGWPSASVVIESINFDDARPLVEREPEPVTVELDGDVDPERFLRADRKPVVVHGVEDSTCALETVGLKPEGHPMVVVEGDHCRMEQYEGFR